MPNLSSLRPVEMSLCVCASISGLTRIATARGLAPRRRHLAQLAQLGDRLDIDLVDVGVERGGKLGAGLADPGEDDALRRNAGGESTSQLAFGDHIGAGAEPGKKPQHRLIGIRLDRIADERRIAGERRQSVDIATNDADE